MENYYSGLLHDCEASLLRVITLVWIQDKNYANTEEDERKITQIQKPYSLCFASQKGKNSTLSFEKKSDFLTTL